MLSNKMTFSLTSLVMLLAIGLVFTPVTMAGVDTEPEPTLNSEDVSAKPGPQVEVFDAITLDATTGTIAVGGTLAEQISSIDTQQEIDAKIVPVVADKIAGGLEFFIRLKTGMAALDDRGADEVNLIDDDTAAPTGMDEADPSIVAESLHIHDFAIAFFDKNGIPIPEEDDDYPGIRNEDSKIEHRTESFPDGRNFKVSIAEEDIPANAAYMTASLPKGAFQNAEPDAIQAAHLDEKKSLKSNKVSEVLRVILVREDLGDPELISIVRVIPTAAAATSRFTAAAVTGAFNVRVTFSEEPRDFLLANMGDRLEIENGEAIAVVPGSPSYLKPDGSEGDYAAAAAEGKAVEEVPNPTGRDARYHSYLVTISPNVAGATFVEIRVKRFQDLVEPPNTWVPPTNLALKAERHLLRVPVSSTAVEDVFADLDPDDTVAAVKAETKLANEVFIPEKLVIPGGENGGYLVLAVGTKAQHGIQDSTAKLVDKAKLSAALQLYNIKSEFALPYPGDDLMTFFRNGGTIQLYHRDIAANAAKATDKADANGYKATATPHAADSVVISEIMWGSDASLGGADAAKSQWIELYNPGADAISIDKYEWVLAFSAGAGTASTTFGLTLIDTVSNASPYFEAPGSSGATQASRQIDVKDADDAIIGAITEDFNLASLTSMYRKIDGATVESGTSAASWAASSADGTLNLSGLRAGTPGAATPYTAPVPPTEPEPTPKPTAPVATAADLMITEIMVASNEGRFPQWIEITNGSVGEVSLMGWVAGIDNDSADADVIAPSLGIKLDGVTLDAGQSALVVSKMSNRNSGVAARAKKDANTGALDSNRIIDASSQVNPPTATYSLLSEMAFRISLESPLPLTGGIADRGDVVGNLGGGWELPMSEEGRSSLIRREMGDSGEIMGTDAAGWVLASETGLGGAYVETFYGDKDDVGTPGYNAGGALPVELSGFGAKRDPLTGTVVITWATQSELNNAGFFIKRSQQKDGKFVIVNPTMIAGAGTTAEKQSYTYTDATADPNIVYYYQIEDVSLDGNRQTLTRAHRLKGHVGAAGKATTTWGELKERQ